MLITTIKKNRVVPKVKTERCTAHVHEAELIKIIYHYLFIRWTFRRTLCTAGRQGSVKGLLDSLSTISKMLQYYSSKYFSYVSSLEPSGFSSSPFIKNANSV